MSVQLLPGQRRHLHQKASQSMLKQAQTREILSGYLRKELHPST